MLWNIVGQFRVEAFFNEQRAQAAVAGSENRPTFDFNLKRVDKGLTRLAY